MGEMPQITPYDLSRRFFLLFFVFAGIVWCLSQEIDIILKAFMLHTTKTIKQTTIKTAR